MIVIFVKHNQERNIMNIFINFAVICTTQEAAALSNSFYQIAEFTP